MTVCVATMANDGALFGAADRMLTRGATQSEPNAPKIYHLTDGDVPVTVMWAGSAAVFGEVIQTYMAGVKAAPHKHKSVQSLVEWYCSCFSTFVGKRAERAILTRLGLTVKDLASNKVSNERAAAFVAAVTEYCLSADESVELIFMGHDDMGAHIWSVFDSLPWCRDVEGFAAIGIGADHADSQLRFAGYTKKSPPAEALIMAYLSKRRAEIAPGVGRATDLCMRAQGVPTPIPETWVQQFDKEYEKFARSEKDALKAAVSSSLQVMQGLISSVTPPSAPADLPEQQPPQASTDGP